MLGRILLLLKSYWRVILRILAACALLTGGYACYWWYYRMVPIRHLADPEWCRRHSRKAFWMEEQRQYGRTGVSPDLVFGRDRIGHYGDEAWFFWLLERAKHPDRFRVCGCTDYALTLMSNHQFESFDKWAEWVEANRARPQEEWLLDGFAEYGVTVHLPPQDTDTVPLLELLGRKGISTLLGGRKGDIAGGVPSFVQYNAFRWLRDSGFDPMEFALSRVDADTSDAVKQGLRHYCGYERHFPREDGLGLLSFAETSDNDRYDVMMPLLLTPPYRYAISALIWGLLLLGVLLLALSFIRKRRKTESIAEQQQ